LTKGLYVFYYTFVSYNVVYAPGSIREGIAVFARSWKVAAAGIRSLTVGRRSDPVVRELRSTPYEGDQSVEGVPDLRKLAATDQRTARDLDALLDRYGVVS